MGLAAPLQLGGLVLSHASVPMQPQSEGFGKSPDKVGDRILFVDDKEMNRKTAGALLGFFCENVSMANSGEEAVEKVSSEQPLIVLMDLLMPGLGGLGATRLIRDLDVPQPVIIAVSGQMATTIRAESRDAGIDGILEKPYTIDDLKTCINDARELYRSRQD